MQQSFEYYHLITAMDSITVDDIGNCQLSAYNDMGLVWYMQVTTESGWTQIREFGPLKNGSASDSMKFSVTYNKTNMEYNEKKICGIIKKFLTDGRRTITQVIELDDIDFNDKLEEFKELL